MEFMRRPNAEENIFVVGDCYSGNQGWVEGALCQAETVL